MTKVSVKGLYRVGKHMGVRLFHGFFLYRNPKKKVVFRDYNPGKMCIIWDLAWQSLYCLVIVILKRR